MIFLMNLVTEIETSGHLSVANIQTDQTPFHMGTAPKADTGVPSSAQAIHPKSP
jgi:hypothetical protein